MVSVLSRSALFPSYKSASPWRDVLFACPVQPLMNRLFFFCFRGPPPRLRSRSASFFCELWEISFFPFVITLPLPPLAALCYARRLAPRTWYFHLFVDMCSVPPVDVASPIPQRNPLSLPLFSSVLCPAVALHVCSFCRKKWPSFSAPLSIPCR